MVEPDTFAASDRDDRQTVTTHDVFSWDEAAESLLQSELCDFCRANSTDAPVPVWLPALRSNNYTFARLKQNSRCIACRLLLRIATAKLNPCLGLTPGNFSDGDLMSAEFTLRRALTGRGEVCVELKSRSGPRRSVTFSVARSSPAGPQSHSCYIDPSQVDFGRLKTWLTFCITSHGINCSAPLRKPTQKRIKLIDVSQRNLIWGDTSHEYLALSYAWGVPELNFYSRIINTQYSKGADIRSLRRQPAALVEESLPQTLEDAIGIAKALDIRYLWIDALCINQTDDTEKAHQLSLMGDIYQSALATIIPGCSDNVFCGIPGIRPGSKHIGQIIEVAENLVFYQVMPSVADHLAESRWGSRGWTYQEACMSTRCLVFTCTEAFFVCATDIQDEGCIARDSVDALEWRWDYAIFNKSGSAEREVMKFGEFARLLRFYTQRALGYSADSLDAFNGVLARLTHERGIAFWHGHPLLYLATSLLWTSCLQDFGKDYSGNTRFSWPEYEKLIADGTFPTWSWANSPTRITYQIRHDLFPQFHSFAPEGSDGGKRKEPFIQEVSVAHHAELGEDIEGQITIQSVSIPMNRELFPEPFHIHEIKRSRDWYNNWHDNGQSSPPRDRKNTVAIVLDWSFDGYGSNSNSNGSSSQVAAEALDFQDYNLELLLVSNQEIENSRRFNYGAEVKDFDLITLLVVYEDSGYYKRAGVAWMLVDHFVHLTKDQQQRTFHLI